MLAKKFQFNLNKKFKLENVLAKNVEFKIIGKINIILKGTDSSMKGIHEDLKINDLHY